MQNRNYNKTTPRQPSCPALISEKHPTNYSLLRELKAFFCKRWRLGLAVAESRGYLQLELEQSRKSEKFLVTYT